MCRAGCVELELEATLWQDDKHACRKLAEYKVHIDADLKDRYKHSAHFGVKVTYKVLQGPQQGQGKAVGHVFLPQGLQPPHFRHEEGLTEVCEQYCDQTKWRSKKGRGSQYLTAIGFKHILK